MIKLDLNNSSIDEKSIKGYSEKVAKIHKEFQKKYDDPTAFLGWAEWPEKYDKEEFARIKKAAKKIQRDSDILVVIGIGG